MPWERLVWLAPLAIAAAGAWRPRWALYLFAFCLPFFGSPPGGPYLGAFDVAAVAAVLTCLRPPRPPRSDLSWPVAVLLFIALASLVPLAYDPPSWHPGTLLRLASTFSGVESWEALYTWRHAADILLGVALFHAARRALWDRGAVVFGGAVAAGLVATGLLGLLEHLELLDLGSYRAIGDLVPVERMHSVFFNSGWLAEYVIVAAPFAVACLAARRWNVAAVLLAALSLVVVVLAQQRGAWLAGLVQIAALAAVCRRQLVASPRLRRRLAMGAAGFLLLLAGVLVASPVARSQALRQRFATSLDDLAGREKLWTASLELARARPLLGWGVGSFAPAYDSIHPPGAPGTQRPRGTAHNWYLNALAETGVLGLAALVLVVTAAAIVLLRARHGDDPPWRMVALGLALSLGGALVYGLVQYMPFLRSIHWLMWMLLAVAVSRPEPRTSRWIAQAAQVLGLIALLWMPLRLPDPAPSWRGDHAFGFREPERSNRRRFHWMGPRAAIRVPWRADCLRVPVANGRPAAGAFPVELTIRTAGLSRRLELRGGWSWEVLEVGAPRSRYLVVELAARPSFRPFLDFPRQGVGPSRDVRHLGAAVRTISSFPCGVE
ncbi:MAG: O-antigen ligase family protein [Thermoanaerobaculia bacterium]